MRNWSARGLMGLSAANQIGQGLGDFLSEYLKAQMKKRTEDEVGGLLNQLQSPIHGPYATGYGTGQVDPFAPQNTEKMYQLMQKDPRAVTLLQQQRQMQTPKYFDAAAGSGLFEQYPGQPAQQVGQVPAKPTNRPTSDRVKIGPDGKTVYEKTPYGMRAVTEKYYLDTGEAIEDSKGFENVGSPENPYSGMLAEQRKESFKKGFIDSFNRDTKKSQEVINQIGIVRDLIQADNPIAHGSIPTYMARVSGEVGMLSEADKAPFGSTRAILEKLDQMMKTYVDGKLTPENAKYLLNLVNTIEKRQNANLRKMAKKRAAQYGKTNKVLSEAELYDAFTAELPPEEEAAQTPAGDGFTIIKVE